MLKRILVVSFLLTAFISVAPAATIENATYNQAQQTLEVSLVYQGGFKTHQFSLQWDSCQIDEAGAHQTSARLIDTGWDDTGTQELRQVVSFDFSKVACKPAEFTLFSDRHSRATLWIE